MNSGEIGNLVRNQLQSGGAGQQYRSPGMPQMQTQQMPQMPQIPQMQQMQGMPAGQGSGLNRFGYSFQPYTPPQYTPQTFQSPMQWSPIAPIIAQQRAAQRAQEAVGDIWPAPWD